MDQFNRTQLRELATAWNPISVSLFMPTVHVEAQMAQNPIRFKNLLRKARTELKSLGHADADIDRALAPAEALLDNDAYWLKLSEGLALFLSPEYTRIYRLPINFNELVVTGNRFHLKPLFPILAANNRFYLLAISQNRVRLYFGTKFGMHEVQTSEIPKSLVDALWYDDNESSRTQVHSGRKVMRARGNAMYHGHGQQAEDLTSQPNDELLRFFEEISDGFNKVVGDEKAPLVLAGVSYYLPIYRQANDYAALVETDIVAGNPDLMSPKEMHAKAWEILEPMFTKYQQDALEQFQAQFNRDEGLASADLTEIVPAAVFSRVDALFVPVGRHQWGSYDSDQNTVTIHDEQQPGDEDLLDFAAVQTYLNGGTVHALAPDRMPVQRHLAATFRFPARVEAERK